jgi:hypothetical protein
MKSFQSGVEPFVVSCKSAEARGPGEASFDDPASGQRHEALFGHRVLDHFQTQAMLLGGGGGVRTCVALIDVGPLDGSAGDTKASDPMAVPSSSGPFNSHRSAAPDKAASFKSLYVNRSQTRCHSTRRKTGGSHTALRQIEPPSVYSIERLHPRVPIRLLQERLESKMGLPAHSENRNAYSMEADKQSYCLVLLSADRHRIPVAMALVYASPTA